MQYQSIETLAEALGIKKKPQPLFVDPVQPFRSFAQQAQSNASSLVEQGRASVPGQIARGVYKETGKGLGIVNEAIETTFGLPGRIATGFNKNVSSGFMEQVGGATERLTGSRTAGMIAGLAAGIIEPFPGGKGKAATRLFHSTKAENVPKILREGFKIMPKERMIDGTPIVKHRDFGDYLYFSTKNKRQLKDYGDTTMKVDLSPDAKVLKIDAKRIEDEDWALRKVLAPLRDGASMGEYDAVIVNGGTWDGLVIVSNPNIVKAVQPSKALLPKPKPLFTEPLTITTRLMNSLRSLNKETVPFTEIKGLMNKGGFTKADTELVISTAQKQGDKVNLTQLQKDIEPHLVTLKPKIVPAENSAISRYGVGQDFVDNVSGYKEIIWESPIKTSAAKQHYRVYTGKHTKVPLSKNYFSHTRFETLPNGDLKLIEVQSDLYQKGQFANEGYRPRPGQTQQEMLKEINDSGISQIKDSPIGKRTAEIAKLEPYDTAEGTAAHLRTFREMVTYGQQNGSKRILIPTGETAMKIEGLGETASFYRGVNTNLPPIKADDLKIGMEVYERGDTQWIITDVLGDGKFKAVPKRYLDNGSIYQGAKESPRGPEFLESIKESFDISGKVNQSHFVYKLNELALPKEALKNGLQVGEPIQVGKGMYRPVDLGSKKKGPQIAFGAAALPLLPGDKEGIKKDNPYWEQKESIVDKLLGRSVVQRKDLTLRDVPIQLYEVNQLKKVVYSEVSDFLDPSEVQTMINVALNQSKRTGRSLMSLMTDKNFFQGITNDRYAQSTKAEGQNKVTQDFVNKTIDEALNGNLEDNTNGANHFVHITTGPHKDEIVSMNEEEFAHYWRGLKSEKDKTKFLEGLLGY